MGQFKPFQPDPSVREACLAVMGWNTSSSFKRGTRAIIDGMLFIGKQYDRLKKQKAYATLYGTCYRSLQRSFAFLYQQKYKRLDTSSKGVLVSNLAMKS